MNVRKYINPSVRLVNLNSTDLGFLLWLKSRQWVIESDHGDKFMVDFDLETGSIGQIPLHLKVGDEIVELNEYRQRINKMNLQYMNFNQYVFEIDGSCLFRDLLFNINKISQWSQSNRFLFSILDNSERFNSINYHISAEYKDIPEWENQFDIYMDKIKDDPIVDHNRVEMPYSISSKFWISINHKTLLDLLSFLKYQCPFFYEIYGKQFLHQITSGKFNELVRIDIDEDNIPTEPSAAITQYILKDVEHWENKKLHHIQGTFNLNLDMGLILYSQFIRQADTKICGLFNELIHEDMEEFSHKVFKGGTILKINYTADEDKVYSTIKTRLCAFAMSSGNTDDPCSWNHFISQFIDVNVSNEDFMKLLPCSFENGEVTNCKFHDDIKFRNEGKEISNCPCPLVTKSLKDAQAKKDRDHNDIGDAFYRLTEYLINGGFDHSIKMTNRWTSDLEIKYNGTIPAVNYLIESIDEILTDLAAERSNYTNHDENPTLIPIKYLQYGLDKDITCMMKGAAIDLIASKLLSDYNELDSFIINFGGDILVYNIDTEINIEGTKFKFSLPKGIYSIFTSGNTAKRGNHIVGGVEHQFSVLFVDWTGCFKSYPNTRADIAATKHFANEIGDLSDLLGTQNYFAFEFNEDGKLLNETYIASPFFNEEQIQIRDNMESQFQYTFRPDKTASSEAFENGSEDPESVVRDNIIGITESDVLVFPEDTDDIGTLFEVGIALGINIPHPIIRYNRMKDEYLIVMLFDKPKMDEYEEDGYYLFDANKKLDVITMGYLSYINPKIDRIYYQLKGSRDNLMLSTNFKHIEYNNEYELFDQIERRKDSRDTQIQ